MKSGLECVSFPSTKRHRDGQDLGAMTLQDFMARLAEEAEVPKGSAGNDI